MVSERALHALLDLVCGDAHMHTILYCIHIKEALRPLRLLWTRSIVFGLSMSLSENVGRREDFYLARSTVEYVCNPINFNMLLW